MFLFCLLQLFLVFLSSPYIFCLLFFFLCSFVEILLLFVVCTVHATAINFSLSSFNLNLSIALSFPNEMVVSPLLTDSTSLKGMNDILPPLSSLKYCTSLWTLCLPLSLLFPSLTYPTILCHSLLLSPPFSVVHNAFLLS